jgi:hypothetical protein
MRFSLYNVVASRDGAILVEKLIRDGFALRRLDGANVRSAQEFWEASAKQLRHEIAKGWDGYADYVASALLPDEDEGNKVALLWTNVDTLIASDLRAFVTAFDVLTTFGRTAYAQGTEMLIFVLGEGAAFPLLAGLESA